MIELEFDIIQKARITVSTDDVEEGINLAIQAVKTGDVSIVKTECDNFTYDDSVPSIPTDLLHKCIATSGTVNRKSIEIIASSSGNHGASARQ